MTEREKALKDCLNYNENNFVSSWGFDLTNDWFTLKNPNLADMDKQDVENMIDMLSNLCIDVSKFQKLLENLKQTL